jgi:drug/metabolite transporter (DMT)-like permease
LSVEAGPARSTDRAFTQTDWVLFVSIALIWGSSFLFIAIGLEGFEPGVITWLRVALGALTLRFLPDSRMRLDAADRTRMVALSFIWTAIPFTLFPLAEQHVNSAVAGLLNGSTPMFAALFAVSFFGRRTNGPQLLGLVVGFGGVVLISVPSLGEGSSEAVGVLMVLVASACYGLAVNIAVPLQDRYGSRRVMARMLALASIWTLPFALVGAPGSHLEVPSVLAVAVLGIVGTGLAYLIMGTLVARVGPTRASFITYLIPVVALVLGVAFRDDEVAPPAVAGVAFVLVGAVLAGRQERPRAVPSGAVKT